MICYLSKDRCATSLRLDIWMVETVEGIYNNSQGNIGKLFQKTTMWGIAFALQNKPRKKVSTRTSNSPILVLQNAEEVGGREPLGNIRECCSSLYQQKLHMMSTYCSPESGKLEIRSKASGKEEAWPFFNRNIACWTNWDRKISVKKYKHHNKHDTWQTSSLTFLSQFLNYIHNSQSDI